jgi:hypothetical protein
MRADIAVYDPSGQLRLIAEVKRKPGASAGWAAQMRRNIVAHGLLPKTDYFLLALPDHFYLWRGEASSVGIRPPDYTIDPGPLLEPYLEKVGLPAESLGERSLVLVVAAWLGECLGTQKPENLPAESRQWLVESGLFEALRGGHLEIEAAI